MWEDKHSFPSVLLEITIPDFIQCNIYFFQKTSIRGSGACGASSRLLIRMYGFSCWQIILWGKLVTKLNNLSIVFSINHIKHINTT